METNKTVDYSQLKPEQLLEVFEKHNVYFDRVLRIAALRKALEAKYIGEKQELEKLNNKNTNEMGIKQHIRLNRLENYTSLSEFQLENDFKYFNDLKLNDTYLKLFWEKMSVHIQSLDLADSIFEDIANLEKAPFEAKNIFKYNQVFKKRVLDENDNFDGIHLVDSVRHFNDTSVATEIRQLSEKYEIYIPKYWTKSDLQLKIKRALKVKDELTPSITQKINSSSIKNLKIICEEHNVDDKLHITKTDMINIIIKNVDKNKVSEIAKVEEIIIEDPVEVPVVVEEVKEEVQVPVVVEPGKDYEDFLKTIIANQEIIIKQNENMQIKEVSENSVKLDRIFNYVVFGLIIIVALIWIIYGIGSLF